MRQGRITRILEAAADVFAECGFERAKVDDIAERAGVAKGTIYYHFQGKDELFCALIADLMQRLIARWEQAVATAPDPVERLRGRVEALSRFLLANRRFAVMLLTEAWGNEARQQVFRAHLRELIRVLERVLREGVQAGVFAVRDTDTAAAGLFGAVSVAVLHAVLAGDAVDEDRIVGQIVDQALQGVMPRG